MEKKLIETKKGKNWSYGEYTIVRGVMFGGQPDIYHIYDQDGTYFAQAQDLDLKGSLGKEISATEKRRAKKAEKK